MKIQNPLYIKHSLYCPGLNVSCSGGKLMGTIIGETNSFNPYF